MLTRFATSFFMLMVLVAPCRAALLINEVVFNEVSSDVTGEWIEIFNTGPGSLVLTDYKIGDEETLGGLTATESMFQFPVGASIGSGELQIVAVNATRFLTVYGVLPTYEVTANEAGVPDMLPYAAWDPDGGVINLANTNDHVYLLGPGDVVVDRISWGNNNAFNPGLAQPVADGQSYERKNAYFDNDIANDFALVADTSVPADQRSTPFAANLPEPACTVMAMVLALIGGFSRRPGR